MTDLKLCYTELFYTWQQPSAQWQISNSATLNYSIHDNSLLPNDRPQTLLHWIILYMTAAFCSMTDLKLCYTELFYTWQQPSAQWRTSDSATLNYSIHDNSLLLNDGPQTLLHWIILYMTTVFCSMTDLRLCYTELFYTWQQSSAQWQTSDSATLNCSIHDNSLLLNDRPQTLLCTLNCSIHDNSLLLNDGPQTLLHWLLFCTWQQPSAQWQINDYPVRDSSMCSYCDPNIGWNIKWNMSWKMWSALQSSLMQMFCYQFITVVLSRTEDRALWKHTEDSPWFSLKWTECLGFYLKYLCFGRMVFFLPCLLVIVYHWLISRILLPSCNLSRNTANYPFIIV